jgi:Tol biopolymer transport system component
MLKRLFIFFTTILLLSGFAIAQKADFETAERFVPEKLRELVGSRMVTPNWLHDSDKFWYSYKTSDGTNFYLVDPNRKQKTLLFDRDKMSAELSKIMSKGLNSNELPITNLRFKENNTEFTFEIEKLKFEYNIQSKRLALLDSVKQAPRVPSWQQFSPDSTWIVFAKNHNLFLMRTGDADSTEIQLTTDGEKWYSYASNDGDTTKNKRVGSRAQWFIDSKKLYLRKQDRRKVEDLFLVHSLSEPRPTLETYKYAMPGEENIPQHELIVFDAATQTRVDIDAAKWKDQSIGGAYFGMSGGIFIGKSSGKIYFIRRDRTWSKIDLCVANTETGSVTVLFSEESKPYFNTRYAQLHIINDGEELIWWSERGGWGHLYLYDGEGNLKNQITSGGYLAGDIARIDTVKRTIYFTGNGREKDTDPYYNMFYKIGFDGSGLKNLTPENGTHSFNMSKSNKFFIDTSAEM